MSCRRPLPLWSRPPQHAWKLDEIKQGNIITTHSLNDVIARRHDNVNNTNCCITFGRIDDPVIIDIVTAHESCSRLHARIAFDQNGTPWLRDLGSGNGTFVNERRLPPEACGKGEESNSNRRGSRGVVLYPGDAIRFGASTRIYILEGPEEFERGAIQLKRKMQGIQNRNQSQSNMEDAPPKTNEVKNEGCSWGMADDIDPAEQEQTDQAADRSNLPPLPSIETFFFSPKYKIPNNLHQLHNQYNTKMHKLQSIQTESQRIMQKENMGVELTDGQKGQLSKNQERIQTLEKDVANLKERIEDGMYTAIHGKERVNKRRKEGDRYHGDNDDEVDDFYDRTASSSSKRQRKENTADDEQSLIQKWKSLLDVHARQQVSVLRTQERCTALQKQIDGSAEDDEDTFFLQNDLALANDNMSKARKSLEETEKEMGEVEYLLKIVNPKLAWDRKSGLIGTNIDRSRSEDSAPVELTVGDLVTQNNTIDESDSLMMPPPPMAVTASSSMPPPPPKFPTASSASASMPPPPPMAKATPSESEPAEEQRILGPMKPPVVNESTTSATEPHAPKEKRKKQVGPMRPPSNVQGTLAALKHAVSQPTPVSGSQSIQQATQCHGKKNAPMISFDPQKDEWSAPRNQDGSGRTALHDKFKGRY